MADNNEEPPVSPDTNPNDVITSSSLYASVTAQMELYKAHAAELREVNAHQLKKLAEYEATDSSPVDDQLANCKEELAKALVRLARRASLEEKNSGNLPVTRSGPVEYDDDDMLLPECETSTNTEASFKTAPESSEDPDLKLCREELEAQKNTYVQHMEEYRQSVLQLADDLARSQTKNAYLTKDKDAIDAQLDEAVRELEAYRTAETNNFDPKALLDCSDALNDAKAQIRTLTDELQAVTDKVQEDDCQVFKDEIKTLKERVEELEDRSKFESRFKALEYQQAAEDSEANLVKCKERVEDLEFLRDSITKNSNDLANFAHDQEARGDRLDRINQNLKAETVAATDVIEQAREDRVRHAAEISRLQKEIADAKKKCDDDLATAQNEIDTLQTARGVLRGQLTAADSRFTQLKADADAAVTNVDNLNTQISNCQDALRDQANDLHARLADRQAQHGLAITGIVKLQAGADRAEADYAAKTAEVLDLNTRLTDSQNRLEIATQQLALAKATAQAKEEANKPSDSNCEAELEAANAVIVQSEASITDLTTQLEVCEEQRTLAKATALAAEKASNQASRPECEDELKAAKAKIVQAQSDVTFSNAQDQTLRDEIKFLNGRLTQVTANLAAARQQDQNAADGQPTATQLAELALARAELALLRTTIQQQSKTPSEANAAQWEADLAQWEADLTQAQEDLAQAQANLTQVQTDLALARATITTLQQNAPPSARDAGAVITALEAKLQQCRDIFDDRVGKLEGELQQAQLDLIDLRNARPPVTTASILDMEDCDELRFMVAGLRAEVTRLEAAARDYTELEMEKGTLILRLYNTEKKLQTAEDRLKDEQERNSTVPADDGQRQQPEPELEHCEELRMQVAALQREVTRLTALLADERRDRAGEVAALIQERDDATQLAAFLQRKLASGVLSADIPMMVNDRPNPLAKIQEGERQLRLLEVQNKGKGETIIALDAELQRCRDGIVSTVQEPVAPTPAAEDCNAVKLELAQLKVDFAALENRRPVVPANNCAELERMLRVVTTERTALRANVQNLQIVIRTQAAELQALGNAAPGAGIVAPEAAKLRRDLDRVTSELAELEALFNALSRALAKALRELEDCTRQPKPEAEATSPAQSSTTAKSDATAKADKPSKIPRPVKRKPEDAPEGRPRPVKRPARSEAPSPEPVQQEPPRELTPEPEPDKLDPEEVKPRRPLRPQKAAKPKPKPKPVAGPSVTKPTKAEPKRPSGTKRKVPVTDAEPKPVDGPSGTKRTMRVTNPKAHWLEHSPPTSDTSDTEERVHEEVGEEVGEEDKKGKGKAKDKGKGKTTQAKGKAPRGPTDLEKVRQKRGAKEAEDEAKRAAARIAWAAVLEARKQEMLKKQKRRTRNPDPHYDVDM